MLKKKNISMLMCAILFAISAVAQEATNQKMTATWALTTGTGTETGVFTPENAGSQFLKSSSMTVGTELNVAAESGSSAIATTYDGYTQTFFKQTKKGSGSSDANAICFLLEPKTGISFTPTKVGLKIARWITDKCSVDISWLNSDGTSSTLASGLFPNRNYNADKNTGDKTCSILSYDISSTKANDGVCGLKVNVYGMSSGKTVSIGDVFIEGSLNGTVGQPIMFSLKVNVSPDNAGTVTVSPVGTNFEKGTSITLSQTPNTNEVFTGWFDENGNSISTASPYTFKIDGNKNMTAKYMSKADMMKGNYTVIPAGDCTSLRNAIKAANAINNGIRQYIFLPNGTYDYGTYVNPKNSPTPYGRDTIFVNNLSIIGENKDSVIIQIEPTTASVSNTAPIVIKGKGTYIQDITFKNNFSYGGNDGQAAALQDDGDKTICKNVKLVSKQDTYYSHTEKGQLYFETSDIHGTVDFICGNGDVYFNKCNILADKRYTNLYSGDTHICAPYTKVQKFDDAGGHGYIFESCWIDCKSQTFDLGRGWRGWPKAAYLNCKFSHDASLRIGVDQTNGKTPNNSLRWTTKGIQSTEEPVRDFYEYNTMDSLGNVISPSSNVLTFTANGSATYETILKAGQIGRFALDSVYAGWTPAKDCQQIDMNKVVSDGKQIVWNASQDAKAYLIELNGNYMTIVDGTTTSYDIIQSNGTYSVRAANMMGGFGKAMETKFVTNHMESIVNDKDKNMRSALFNLSGQKVNENYKGIVIRSGKKIIQ